MVNQSVNTIEYELTSRLRMLMRTKRPSIAILDKINGLLPVETADLEASLKEYYDVERVALDQQVDALSEKPDGPGSRINKYDLLVVAKPESAFSNKDKVIIDQFIMNGGRVLWLVDPIRTSLDSLRKNQFVLAESNELGIYDMLFDYGVRLNRNLIIDYRCALIMLDGGPMGNQRSMQMSNWYFAPVSLPDDKAHPIASNLDPIHFDFASSLDTVGENPLVKKTVLLASSDLSLERKAPVRVSANIAELELDYFQNGPHQSFPLAVLLEGEFYSNFRGRLPDTLMRNPEFAFREKSLPTRMIVIGDGDIARNKVMPVQGGLAPLPLGFDRYANRVIYDNKEFLMNAVNYLLDDPEMISVRSRTIELRKLDAALIREKRNLIQFTNVVLPIALVVLLGIAVVYIRKRKYSKP
jgi:gliding-associated putative ABC transporter substrate-binding component GldG